MRSNVVVEDPRVSYIITYDGVAEKASIRLDRSYSFLPEWFLTNYQLSSASTNDRGISSTAAHVEKRARTDSADNLQLPTTTIVPPLSLLPASEVSTPQLTQSNHHQEGQLDFSS